MSSITAIYSQINRPANSKANGRASRALKTTTGAKNIIAVNGITAANTTAMNGISNDIQTHHRFDEDDCFDDNCQCFEHYVTPASDRSNRTPKLNTS